jgi:D-beta-D-heptose 7-phosphate kinase/D-beta-D-heptose 1-phosphate adenosyltransferase
VNPDLAKTLSAIGQPRILVVGDLMLDRYVWGSVERISPEAPIPILKVTDRTERPGGAGSVVVNLAYLGARVAFATALGNDPAADILRNQLGAYGVDLEAALTCPDKPTTVKTRYLARVQQVLRVDEEDPSPLPKAATDRLFRALEPKLEEADIVLIPDYNKGLLTPSFLQSLIVACRRLGKRILVDPARGVGHLPYRGATAICPNRVEAAELAGMPCSPANLDKIGRRLLRRLGLEASIVTMDRDGIALYRAGQKTFRVKARAREVFDVTGAGDMVLSVLGFVLAGGGAWEEAVEIANVAGGIEVGKLGVVPLAREEILADLEHPDHAPATKLRSREELATLVRNLKSQGRTVVFTNGCFDLLNANHISLLRHSKGLGDCLIVATNSDASIRRLKGPSRPILSEPERVELLSAVHYVDYVTVFPEDTPRPLLSLLQPDILVKGGDYTRKEEVVGWEIVEAYGGRIERAPKADFHSTSRIVRKVLDSHREGQG